MKLAVIENNRNYRHILQRRMSKANDNNTVKWQQANKENDNSLEREIILKKTTISLVKTKAHNKSVAIKHMMIKTKREKIRKDFTKRQRR